MPNSNHDSGIELICAVVNFGSGGKLLHAAKQLGIMGGTIFIGSGTANSRILEFLGLSEVRKEIVLMLSDAKTASDVIEKLDETFKFEKPNHGIIFTTDVRGIVGTRTIKTAERNDKGAEKTMYQVITVIVDKGKSELVTEAAAKAGSKGGTIINGRGCGIHEISKVFSMEIEPEKEIVMILSEDDMTDGIVDAIRQSLEIDEPGNGIIFIQDVNKAYGLYR